MHCIHLCVCVCVPACASGFWQPLELICEKAIATCNRPLGAGEALRRVMECLASGILLSGELTCILGEAPPTPPQARQGSAITGAETF